MPDEVVTAVGLDLQHLPDEERPLDPAQPIGGAAVLDAIQCCDVQALLRSAAGTVVGWLP